MKAIAGLAALCVATGLAFAVGINHSTSSGHNTPPQIRTTDGPITLQEGVNTVLNAGIQQDGQDPPPGQPDTGGGSSFTYCTAAVNSTGFPSNISFVGTLNLADNSFGMQTINLPPHAPSWGMYTYGQTQYNVPFGNGFLCISPFFPGLFKMPTQSLATGVVVNTMALHPAQFTAFTPGSGWNFQFWYRDPTAGGSNFNLSDGLHVNFAP
jgi:hypothetical protein